MRVAFNQIRSWHAYENDGISLQALSIGFMHVMGDKDLSDKLVEDSLKVSPEGVQRAAKRYLSEKNRVVCEYQSVE
jgi:hypothetical protein